MPENDGDARPVAGEVIPAERRDVQLPPNRPAGISLLVQAKYWAARRELESYTKALAAQTAALRELKAREDARLDFARSLVRAEHLGDIRRIEELKVVDELAELIDRSEVRELNRRTLRAQAEAEAIDAERRLQALKNPPAAPESKSGRSAIQQASDDIAKMRKDGEALKKTFIESCGGEDNMTQEDRDFLSQIEVGTRNKMGDRLENL
jgi:hypothetical protein